MAFKKGQSGNPKGKPPGTLSKFTTLKAAFISVFEKLGGEEALYKWAADNNHNRSAFYQWLTKMLPADVELKQSGEVKHEGKLTIEVIQTKPGA